MSTRDSLGNFLDSNDIIKKKQIASAFKIKLSLKNRQNLSLLEIIKPAGVEISQKKEKSLFKTESEPLITLLKRSLEEEISSPEKTSNNSSKDQILKNDIEKQYKAIFESEIERKVINTKIWSGNNVIRKPPLGKMERILRVFLNARTLERKGYVSEFFFLLYVRFQIN